MKLKRILILLLSIALFHANSLIVSAEYYSRSKSWYHALEEGFKEWEILMRQSYICYYPETEKEFEHAGYDLQELLENMTIGGQKVEIDLSDSDERKADNLIHSVYSTYNIENPTARLITYLIVEHEGEILTLVSEDTDPKSTIDFHETANQELSNLVKEVDNKYFKNISNEKTVEINLTDDLIDLLDKRDENYSPEEFEIFVRQSGFSTPNENMKVDNKYTFSKKGAGHPFVAYFDHLSKGVYKYSVSQGGPSFGMDAFAVNDQIIEVLFHRGSEGTIRVLSRENFRLLDEFTFSYQEWQDYQDYLKN
ncbi:DUF4767 domain-containing protein [Facklamia sp. P12945]|uniref:DUF4767 domain-containing protein n=1 Tax=Facklamia sp. P12945 TaxID=3421950 RepID=UPI003D1744E8